VNVRTKVAVARAALLTAMAAGILALGAAGVGLLGRATAHENCSSMMQRVMALDGPTKRVYAVPGHQSWLPALAGPHQIARCGDPERLLEHATT
jgi:hypothetical protein